MIRVKRALMAMVLGLTCANLPLLAGNPPQGSSFTYQGLLRIAGNAFSGTADLQFRLLEGPDASDLQVGSPLVVPGVVVTNGTFAVELDFGLNAFDGMSRWLEIAVATPGNGGAGPFTALAPTQQISSTPYAIRAMSVGHVDNAALSGTYSNALTLNNASNQFTGAFSGVHSGSGAGLTNLNASSIASGTLASARLSGAYTNVLNLSNVGNSFVGNFSGTHSGPGAGLTGLNASNLASGNLNAARLPTSGNWSLASVLNVDANTLVINPTNDRVGVGVASPLAPLHVEGPSSVSNVVHSRATSNGQTAGRFEGTDNNNKAVWATVNGIASSAAFLDASGEFSAGAFIRNSTISGETYGVYVDADSPDGWAAYVLGSRSYFDGRIGIGETSPLSLLHIRAPDDAINGPIVRLQGNGANQAESGRIRFVENNSYQGMFMHYDGVGNRLHLGGHNLQDSVVANDRNHLVIERDSGHVGIGVADPTAPLQIEGTSTDLLLVQANASGQRGGRFIANAASTRGVWASANGTAASALFAESSGQFGAAVVAHDNALTGESYGIYASTDSPDGSAGYFVAPDRAIHAVSSAANSCAILAEINGSSGTALEANGGSCGVFATVETLVGIGTLTVSNGQDGIGLRAISAGTGVTRAIEAFATSPTGFSTAVLGSADSPNGIGGSFSSAGLALRLFTSHASANIIEAFKGFDLKMRLSNSGSFHIDGAYNTGGADYAEWLPLADDAFVPLPGMVVGVRNGRVLLRTTDADHVLVVSTNPGVVGNNAGAEADGKPGHALIALLGQAPVKVRGSVQAGDVILASNSNDGCAIAIASNAVTVDLLDRVVGTAWESCERSDLRSINVAIGLDQTHALRSALRNQQTEIEARDRLIAQLADRLSRLEAVVESPVIANVHARTDKPSALAPNK